MATIYPFSIYTSKGKVYPSSGGGESLIVDLSWLGWEPELIKNQIDSVNKIVENKTLDIPAYDNGSGLMNLLYMLPDLSMLDLSKWNTNPLNLSNQRYMSFKDNTLTVDFSKINSIKESSFYSLYNLESIQFIGKAKVLQSEEDKQLGRAKLTNLFSNCYNLTSITGLDLTDYAHIYAENMFINCHHLRELNISISKPYESVSHMFNYCYELEEIHIQTIDMSDVANAESLFDGCRNLHTFPTLTNMDNVQRISYMFRDCNGGSWEWNPSEHPYQGTVDVEISFAQNANVENCLWNSYVIHSVTINTTNMPEGNNFVNMWDDINWLSQLKIYVPASVVTAWIELIKSSAPDEEKQAIVDNMVEAIQN